LAEQPKIRKGSGPDQLPQGAAGQLNKAAPAPSANIGGPAPVGPVEGLPPEMAGIEERLFAPTDRPDEPLTQGLPFGEGNNFRKPRNETPEQFRVRTADSLLTSKYVDPVVRDFAERLKKGE